MARGHECLLQRQAGCTHGRSAHPGPGCRVDRSESCLQRGSTARTGGIDKNARRRDKVGDDGNPQRGRSIVLTSRRIIKRIVGVARKLQVESWQQQYSATGRRRMEEALEAGRAAEDGANCKVVRWAGFSETRRSRKNCWRRWTRRPAPGTTARNAVTRRR